MAKMSNDQFNEMLHQLIQEERARQLLTSDPERAAEELALREARDSVENQLVVMAAEQRTIMHKGKKRYGVFRFPLFIGFQAPDGFLTPRRESHALFMYNAAGCRTYENTVKDVIVYEGDKDPVANFRQLFEGVARLYGVKPHVMAKFWPQVDKQCEAIGYSVLPNEEQYRFNRVPEIFIGDKQ